MSAVVVDRIRLLGSYGSNKLMAGETNRLVRRAFEREEREKVLGSGPSKIGSVGIALPFSPTVAALLSTYHRTSARILWDLYESREKRLEPLYEGLYQLVAADDRDFLFQGAKISILTFDPFSIEAGERQVVGAVKNALLDGARARGINLTIDPDSPDLSFHVRSHEDDSGPVLTLSLDLAGRPMHERGYRTKAGEAPLREDVAALLVLFARHQPKTEAVFDPLAGSGTLLVEATELAQARPLWTSGRSARFSSHPVYGGAYEGLGSPLFGDTRPPLFGVERDPATFALLERTLTTAGARRDATIFESDFRDVDPARIERAAAERGYGSLLLISNPPYGSRLKGSRRELAALYRDLGGYFRALREVFPGSVRASFILGEDPNDESDGSIGLFLHAFGLEPRIKKPMRNGPLRAMFLSYE